MVLQSKEVNSRNVRPQGGTCSSHRALRARTRTPELGLKPTKYAVERARRRDILRASVDAFRPSTTRPSSHLAANVPDGAQGKDPLLLPFDISQPNNPFKPSSLYLYRPEYKEVPRASLEAVDPDYADLEPSFIRDSLLEGNFAANVFAAMVGYKVKESKFPHEMHITVGPDARATHMLAVHGPPDPMVKLSTKLAIQMYPVYGVVIVSHCAKLAPFPPTNPRKAVPGGWELTLPIMMVSLPSPATFPILLEYLYLKRANVVFGRLLTFTPMPSAVVSEPEEQVRLAQRLIVTTIPQMLTQVLLNLAGFWENVCSLGVYDDELWTVIDAVRKIALMAIAFRHGRLDAVSYIQETAEALDCEDELAGEDLEEGELETDMGSEYEDVIDN